MHQIEQAKPAQRIILLLNYFDTCQAVLKQPAIAFQTLDALDAIGQQQSDDQLRRYGRFLRNTYAKNNPTLSNQQKDELFLHVGPSIRPSLLTWPSRPTTPWPCLI